MKKSVYLIVIALLTAIYFGCSDDDKSPTKPKPDTILKVSVMDKTDSSVVANSNVVVYEAATGQSVTRDLTDAEGICYFMLEEGNYYLEVTAQGYDPSPAPNVTPVPFFVAVYDTTEQNRMLYSNGLTDIGYIEGSVVPEVNNVLLIAENTADQNRYSGISGPDGYFVIYNLPYGTYDIESFKAAYKQTAVVTSNISSGSVSDSVTVSIEKYAGSSISGSVTFLATNDTLDVDIVLRDPKTGNVVPGLRTHENLGNYSLDSIPDGSFEAWASFENDGYVLDPDWLFKNPGGLNLTFPTDSGSVLNFSVTGSIKLEYPTNPADSIYAFTTDSATAAVPVFRWTPYPSSKEYFIEVRDINGNRVWGGFNSDGTVNHGYIDDSVTEVQYDFDGTASSQLVPGEIYQWKIWADKGTAADSFVEQLISSSEDLRGLFQVPVPEVKK
ncbi:MAG TPA: carboxypeptidase-like regulatory domain-containing protein [Clostridiales bacterium]|nr:carboxypeptidase-like regulatory domain-containing protein [Clostridiales bacterium]